VGGGDVWVTGVVVVVGFEGLVVTVGVVVPVQLESTVPGAVGQVDVPGAAGPGRVVPVTVLCVGAVEPLVELELPGGVS
jgi:hypothetical protein